MTPEGKVKQKVKKMLASIPGLYAHWPVQNGMGSPTLDCIACCRGRYVGIETKAVGKKLTPRQELTMNAMIDANANVFVLDTDQSIEECRVFLESLGLVWQCKL